ncbi:MAG TPA: glycerate kinase, partial [Candidatus Limnocylindrales bacterium]|nr:glycerate kinase [Candidatus Limnocylindrales bacterium]
ERGERGEHGERPSRERGERGEHGERPSAALSVVFAPDSFKGTLSSVQVATAFAAGWARARPGDELQLAPLADGGQGTLDAIETAGGWSRRTTIATDPLGRPISAAFLVEQDRAIVEMAEASGLFRLTTAERDAYGATSRGTGELLLAALEGGARHVTLGIGGSATTDGGRGLLEGLGASVVGPGGEDHDWSGISVDLATLDERIVELALEVACDVDNPLLGPRGAAATYGPQKGALPDDVPVLDRRNAAWADALEAAAGRAERETAGAGAAGGVGFALLCLADRFGSFALRPGVELVMEAIDFDAALENADVIVTGEGRIDAQTAHGKTAFGVAKRAQAAGVACHAIGGSVEPEGAAALARVGCLAIAANDEPVSLEQARAAGTGPIEAAADRLARSLTMPG